MARESVVNSVFRFAVCSRIFLLFLSFISNLIVPDHEASDVFIYKNRDEPEVSYFLDRVVYTLFGGLIRWDANYFLHIAHYGYTSENMLAFFPLFPFTIRIVASLLYLFLSWSITYGALLLLSSVLINFFLFVKCSTLLYDLTWKITKDYACAYYSAIIFCANPASVFFTAPYSETLYCYLTFLAMYYCFDGSFAGASLVSGLSSAARSNGTLNVGFVLYTFFAFFITNFTVSLSYVGTFVILLVVFVISSLAPFGLFQLYSYVKFCLGTQLIRLVQTSSWCEDTIPLAYSHVQKQYWNVGFLNYYEIKQLPNFLLAAPIIYILMLESYKTIACEKALLHKLYHLQTVSELFKSVQDTIDKLNRLVFVIHVVILTAFCILFVHIQVSTRMLCSTSPVFYWFVAKQFTSNYSAVVRNDAAHKLRSDLISRFACKTRSDVGDSNKQPTDTVCSVHIHISHYWKMFYRKENSLQQFCLIFYCLSYFVFGTILFSNFYPWT